MLPFSAIQYIKRPEFMDEAQKSDSNKIAVITGAGGGIGKTIASTLARNNWIVAVNDIDTSATSKVCDDLNNQGCTALAVCGDIGSEPSVVELYSTIERQLHNPASLLINNAGVQTWAGLSELTTSDWRKTINTNLTGCFLMTKYFAANAPQGSSIINIGSGCNKLAFPNLVDYSASKGGIEMLTKSSALELGPKGVRVNCIAPGSISTERTVAETEFYDARWAELTPLGRIGTPEDIANAVMLLIDEKAGFITGQTINVDGGLFSRAVWPADY